MLTMLQLVFLLFLLLLTLLLLLILLLLMLPFFMLLQSCSHAGFPTYVDVDVDAIVLVDVASGVFIVVAKPNVTDA